MKKINTTPADPDDPPPEVDFSNGVRGKYTKALRPPVHMVTLDPDVSRVFKNGEMVNQALRSLIQFSKEAVTHPAKVSGGNPPTIPGIRRVKIRKNRTPRSKS